MPRPSPEERQFSAENPKICPRGPRLSAQKPAIRAKTRRFSPENRQISPEECQLLRLEPDISRENRRLSAEERDIQGAEPRFQGTERQPSPEKLETPTEILNISAGIWRFSAAEPASTTKKSHSTSTTYVAKRHFPPFWPPAAAPHRRGFGNDPFGQTRSGLAHRIKSDFARLQVSQSSSMFRAVLLPPFVTGMM